MTLPSFLSTINPKIEVGKGISFSLIEAEELCSSYGANHRDIYWFTN